MENLAHTTLPIHELLQRRWSPRAFSEKLIDPETLTRLFEAARWSPSWRNDQPWRFIVATRGNETEFQKMFACLKPGNQHWAGKAAALVAVVTKLQYGHHEEPNPTTYYDAGQAIAHLTVEAMNNDLYVHQMGGVDRPKIREIYGIPAEYNPIVVIAIGYLGQIEDLAEDIQQRERRERVRKPLDEIVFSGEWENPADLAD